MGRRVKKRSIALNEYIRKYRSHFFALFRLCSFPIFGDSSTSHGPENVSVRLIQKGEILAALSGNCPESHSPLL